jgi:beta-glucanase (GH16 family)
MNKKIFYILILPIIFLMPFKAKSQCWELVWAEEFNYTGFPDPAIWTFETGGTGWGNNELQYYKANDEDNAWVSDGRLKITALKENYGGRNYTSTRIITRDKYSVKYGKIEARMKLPYGKGIWPAFWALGQNFGTVGWPACGEIDVMEFIGGPTTDNKAFGTAHWDNNGSHAHYGGSYTLPSGIFADDYQVFSVIWDSQQIRWFVNDIQYHVISITPAALSEFHNDFFLLLNMAVGGNWPGSPDGTTVFPQTFEIDYVRVYKSTADVQKIPVAGEESIPPMATGKQYSLPYAEAWEYNWTVPEDAIIESGQGTEKIVITWGCTEGTILCTVTGECGTYEFSKNISLQTTIKGPKFVAENQQNVLFYVDSMAVTTFEWIFPEDVTIISGQGTDSILVNWGTTFEDVSLKFENSCGVAETSFPIIKAGQYPFPDILTRHSIPGTIEAVDFDYGGKGIAYHDVNTGNSGNGPRQDTDVDTEYGDKGSPNVGWIMSGEWLEYSIKVETDSFYSVDMRLATANASGGPFSVLFNDETLLSGITIANTGGWANFTTKKVGTVYLTQADTLMRIFFNTGNFNLGKMTFTPTLDPSTNVMNGEVPVMEIFPNPARDMVTIRAESMIKKVTLIDLQGGVLEVIDGNEESSVVFHLQNYRNGMYILQIELTDNQLHYERILKME